MHRWLPILFMLAVASSAPARGQEATELLAGADLSAGELYRKPDERSWGQVFGRWFRDASFGKSYALVIGVSDYQSVWSPLTATRNDPQRIRDLLVDQEGFDLVVTLRDGRATKQRIDYLMRDVFPVLVGHDDRFLFYFSGHGTSVKIQGRGEVGYLPLAASGKIYSRMISMEDVRAWDRLLGPVRQVLFLLDACFSGLAGLQPQSDRAPKSIDEGLTAYAHHLMTAGTGGQETIAGDQWSGSIFTDSLLRAVEGRADASTEFEKDGVVSLNELEAYVRKRVADEASAAGWDKRITPQLFDLASDNEGEFFFVTRQMKLEGDPKATLAEGLPTATKGPSSLPALQFEPVEREARVTVKTAVRLAPSAQSERVATLEEGAMVYVTERVVGEPWVRIEQDGRSLGFVLDRNLGPPGPSASPPPASATAPDLPAAAPSPPPSAPSSAPDISGSWEDANGTRYEIRKTGDRFSFDATNIGNPNIAAFRTTGTLTLDAMRYRSRYEGRMVGVGAIRGTCDGTIDPSFEVMSGACRDDDPRIGEFITILRKL